MIRFDSDYMAGAHPEVLEALVRTNMELTAGYGNDPYTAEAKELIRKATGCADAEVMFLVGGTQTNATVIDGILSRHEGVLAAESGHIAVHESGAIEASGHKVLTLPHYDGKVKAEDVEHFIEDFYADETYQHMVAPGMLYISQPTEYGTVYSLEELKQLSEVCHNHDIPLYVDGARLGYGLTSSSSDITLPWLAQHVDAFYSGGTKVGAMFGEAVVFSNIKAPRAFFTTIKRHGALLAKGRMLGIQFDTLFTDNLYLRVARHANEMAERLRDIFLKHGKQMGVDSPTNQQFVILTPQEKEELMRSVAFEVWSPLPDGNILCRFVTSWATTEEDLVALDKALAEL
jgi:threonine aldolase